jgi:hypothetical protein
LIIHAALLARDPQRSGKAPWLMVYQALLTAIKKPLIKSMFKKIAHAELVEAFALQRNFQPCFDKLSMSGI